MRIVQYEYLDPESKGWRFSKVEFGRVNLVVGDSGMGKTRLLNTIFNLGSQVTSKRAVPGQWYLTLEGEEARSEWTIRAEHHPERGNLVSEELLRRHVAGEETVLVDRKHDEFVFKGNLLPKLSLKETSISLLQEEDDIRPLYDTFSRMLRRRFYEADLSENCSIGGFPFGMLDRIGQDRELGELFQVRAQHKLNLNGTLAILANHFRVTFDEICSLYSEVFPFITEIEMLDVQELDSGLRFPGQAPVFCIKEKGVDQWITLDNLSSGMQKVLLILTDVFVLPRGGIYFID